MSLIMKSISLVILLSFVASSRALPQFNQAFPNQQQQRFPNIIGNQNPFLPGNQGFGLNSQSGQQPNFGNQQGFGSQQQRPGFGGQQQQQPNFEFGSQQQGFGGQQSSFGNQQEFGGQQQQPPSFGGQQTSFGGQQEANNNNQQQTTPATPGASSSIVGTPQFVLCNQNCPSVNQYNPICGSDQITYNNQYRLDCANECGRQLDPNWQEITIFSRRNCVSGSRVA